jgi:hypothetical protein
MIVQMGVTLIDTLKNLNTGRDNYYFTSGVKVEVKHLKDDHWAKVPEIIQLNISMVTLHGFEHDFDEAFAFGDLLPVKHSDKDGLGFKSR